VYNNLYLTEVKILQRQRKKGRGNIVREQQNRVVRHKLWKQSSGGKERRKKKKTRTWWWWW